MVERIFQSVRHDGQGFNAALAVLRLSRKYSAARLGRACSMALATGKRSPRYRDVEPILRGNQDMIAAARDDGGPGDDEDGYVCGADFYGEV